MKHIIRYAFVVFATLSILGLLWAFRGALVAFVLSLLIAATIRPIIAALIQRGFPALAAQGLVVLALIGGVAMLLYGFGPPLTMELDSLIDSSISAYDQLYTTWLGGETWQQAMVERLPTTTEIIDAIAGRDGGQFAGTLLGLTQGFVGAVSDGFLIIILSIYWSQDQARFERLMLSLLPPNARIHTRNAWRTTEQVVGQFIRSEVIQSLLVAVILAVGFRMAGLPYPTIMAIVAAALWVVVWLVPNVGLVIIGGIVFAVGLTTGWMTAVAATALTIVLMGIIEWWVEPRLFDRDQFSSVLTLIVMIPLTTTYGLLGLLIAPPLAAAIQTVGAEAMRFYTSVRSSEVELSGLHKRYDEVQNLYDRDEADAFPPEMESILMRLRKLISETEALIR